jgi:membrane-associated protease RseP (regulator of RpoE activity)
MKLDSVTLSITKSMEGSSRTGTGSSAREFTSYPDRKSEEELKITNAWKAAAVIVLIVGCALLVSDSFPKIAVASEWKSSTDKSPAGAFMGVYPESLDDDDREALNYKGTGVLIEGVVEDGPAEKAGIESGDIVIKMGDEKIEGIGEFRDILGMKNPGDKLKVTVVRKGKEVDCTVELGKKKHENIVIDLPDFSKKVAFLGVETMDVEDDLADYFGVKHGALVEKVVKKSAAKEAGLMAGDVIVKIGSHKIKGSDDVADAVHDYEPGDSVDVVFVRKGVEQTVKVTLGKRHSLFSGDQHRITIRASSDGDEDEEGEDDEIVIDRETMKEALKEARKELKAAAEEIRREMENLKQELDKMQEEMEKSKDQKKDEPKKN